MEPQHSLKIRVPQHELSMYDSNRKAKADGKIPQCLKSTIYRQLKKTGSGRGGVSQTRTH